MDDGRLVLVTVNFLKAFNLMDIDIASAGSPRQSTSVWGKLCKEYMNTYCFKTSLNIQSRWKRNSFNYKHRVLEKFKEIEEDSSRSESFSGNSSTFQ